MVFLALRQKMRQVYAYRQRRKFLADYMKSSLSVRDNGQSRNISTCLYYHWKKRFDQESSSVVELDVLLSEFRPIIKLSYLSCLTMTLHVGINICLLAGGKKGIHHGDPLCSLVGTSK